MTKPTTPGIAELQGMRLISIPDDDERWKEVAPFTVLGNERDIYVRESEYPTVRDAIDQAIAQRGGKS